MTTIDERIKQELERESSELDSRFTDEGLPAMVSASFKGAMRSWMWFVGICTTLMGGLTIWLAIAFSRALGAEDMIFWGVWFILATIVTMGFEMWCWMQVNRLATKREIERLDLVIRENAPSAEIDALSLAIEALSAKLRH